jgi:hypothetical protein
MIALLLTLSVATAPVAAQSTRGEVHAKAFDALCDDMAKNYSYFAVKQIDWPALREKYRPKAAAAQSLPEFITVLGDLLGELKDGHVRFIEPQEAKVNYQPPPFKTSANGRAMLATIRNAKSLGNNFAIVGTTGAENFPVMLIIRQTRADDAGINQAIQFIRNHKNAPGFLIDLRGANGGNEVLAQRLASEFCPIDTVYAKQKIRAGPRPTDFGPTTDRILQSSGAPFTKPVVCILGEGCVSSGEGFALMFDALPNVTTVGLPTRGSSGNPKPFKLPDVPITVNYSRWVAMTADGTPIEGRGVLPDVVVDLPADAYTKADPTWQKAVELLREGVKKTEN